MLYKSAIFKISNKQSQSTCVFEEDDETKGGIVVEGEEEREGDITILSINVIAQGGTPAYSKLPLSINGYIR
jgi:hypothetical protein